MCGGEDGGGECAGREGRGGGREGDESQELELKCLFVPNHASPVVKMGNGRKWGRCGGVGWAGSVNKMGSEIKV